jgi:predicted nucleic acid-binding protein
VRWYAGIRGEGLYLSVLVVGEIRIGIERLRRLEPIAAGRLATWLVSVQTELTDRMLPVTTGIADR